jgi:predicted outer membrane repeat protein
MSRFRALVMMLSLVTVLFAYPRSVLAAKPIIVGNGTAASCTEAALNAALQVAESAGGGTIRFNCGPQPVSIALTTGVTEVHGIFAHIVMPPNTTLDGEGLITLDGTRTGTVVFVDTGTTAALRGLTIINGKGPDDLWAPGGIANFGSLTITASIVSANWSFFFWGTAGIWNTGFMTIVQSEISDNVGGYAGSVANEGTLTIRDTTVADNWATEQGAGINNKFGGILEIVNTAFVRNQSGDNSGGAILNAGVLTVKRSLFAENVSWSGSGGAIDNHGTLTVNDSMFAGNEAHHNGGGGAIQNWGALTVTGSTFSGNVAATYGGGIFTAGALTIKGSIITHNTAFAGGGGIYLCTEGDPNSFGCHGTLTLKDTIVTENTPDDIFPTQ